jgi:exodeoxyribonuclease-5
VTQLNDQQAAGLAKVQDWYEASAPVAWSPVFRWFGYAGTGKTFTAARIPEALGISRVVFGTYTGKAASVLRRSLTKYGADFPVTTIHSAIYFPTTSKAAKDALEAAREELRALVEQAREDPHAPHPDPAALTARMMELEAALPRLEANARRLRFELNPDSDWADADLIILDEVSMVNEALARDIESYGVPILVLGDPAQLPPVEGGGHYTAARPDVLLTKIERQAIEGNPIVELATRVRTSQGVGLGLAPADLGPKSLKLALQADMVLTYTNRMRWKMITAIRAARKLPIGRPAAGDVIMNLTNNKDQAVFNGQTFTVLPGPDFYDTPESVLGWSLRVRDEDGNERDLNVFREGFQGQAEQERAKGAFLGGKGDWLLCTFAQAITVHKAQGSEAEKVYVVNETPRMLGRPGGEAQARQWLYTAVTRARSKVIISQST